jgi:hypothetical protein
MQREQKNCKVNNSREICSKSMVVDIPACYNPTQVKAANNLRRRGAEFERSAFDKFG